MHSAHFENKHPMTLFSLHHRPFAKLLSACPLNSPKYNHFLAQLNPHYSNGIRMFSEHISYHFPYFLHATYTVWNGIFLSVFKDFVMSLYPDLTQFASPTLSGESHCFYFNSIFRWVMPKSVFRQHVSDSNDLGKLTNFIAWSFLSLLLPSHPFC